MKNRIFILVILFLCSFASQKSYAGWVEMENPATSNFRDIWGSSGNNVYAVGTDGTILHYNGSTWINTEPPTLSEIVGISGSSSDSIYAVDVNARVLHYDGVSWEIMDNFPQAHTNSSVWATPQDVFVGGTKIDTGIDYYPVIWNYDGNIWSFKWASCLYIGSATINDMWVGNSGSVYMVFEDNFLGYVYQDNRCMDIPTVDSLNGIWGSSDTDIFAVGDEGAILHYDGSTWNEMQSPVAEHLYGIWGSSGTNVFAVGKLGTILHYDGSSWTQMAGAGTGSLYGIWGSSDTNIFAVGSDGTILHYDGINDSGFVVQKFQPINNTSVLPGESLGPIKVFITNPTEMDFEYYVQQYFVGPNGDISYFPAHKSFMEGGGSKTMSVHLSIPENSEYGRFRWGVEISDLNRSVVDNDFIKYTVIRPVD